ncbi:MAG: hypothetical protein Q3998_01260 [Porphyromonas sp.]|nr:hypothetical protein [Porphyromonas sp.]
MEKNGLLYFGRQEWHHHKRKTTNQQQTRKGKKSSKTSRIQEDSPFPKQPKKVLHLRHTLKDLPEQIITPFRELEKRVLKGVFI